MDFVYSGTSYRNGSSKQHLGGPKLSAHLPPYLAGAITEIHCSIVDEMSTNNSKMYLGSILMNIRCSP